MIDFRYHLVSLVSVFLALAVGIVLGAGPLKDSIGDTLAEQVRQLRADRDSLREEVTRGNASVQHRDALIQQVSPQLLDGVLGGRPIVLLTLPDAKADLEPLREAVQAAGGTVSGEVRVTKRWTDPERVEQRDQVARELVAAVPEPAKGRTTDQQLAALLARAVLARELASAGGFDETSRTVLDRLAAAELIEVEGELSGRASAGLLVIPGSGAADGGGTAASTSSGPTEAETGSWLTLTQALDAGSDGLVVLGPPSSAGDGGLLAQIRDDDALTSQVSTVDTGETSMGPLTAMLALSEQLRGEADGYGFADGASAPLPQVEVEQ